jgi:ribosomal protein S18 acetylase RimI-like enzyme
VRFFGDLLPLSGSEERQKRSGGQDGGVQQDVLDNAGWHSLVGLHAGFAEGTGQARRYRSDVAMFHAAPDDSAASWRDLAALASSDGTVVVFRGTPMSPPAGWVQAFGGDGHQMVLDPPLSAVPDLPAIDPVAGAAVTMRALDDDDVVAMVALVTLTEPGPFRPRTIELGGYIGIFHDEQLVAMAGQRLRPPGYCEVSAVCTHPDARRRGYASIVTAHVAATIAARGETPFLHVASTNSSARAVYEQLGFATRRIVSFAAFRVPA